jgi:sodium transport system permease protein
MSPDERTPRLYHAGWTASDSGLTFALAIITFLLLPVFAGVELLGLAVAELVGLALVPILVVVARKQPLSVIGLAAPPWRAVVGAVVMGLAIWYLAAWITDPWQRLVGGNPDEMKPVEDILHRTPVTAILVLTFVPAFCEEIATRGLLAVGLRPRLGPIAAVAIATAAFALMHVSVVRALPTAFLGAIFGILAVRSRSLVPSMIVHAMNNGLALLVSSHRLGFVERALERHPDDGAIVAALLVAAGLGIALPKRN